MYRQFEVLATSIVVTTVILVGSLWLMPNAGKSESRVDTVDTIILAGSSPCNPRVEVCES